MSVLVKDMEMPKCCYNCFIPCDVLPLGYHKLDEFREQRYEDCPLVEVPTPHGDLIDRNKIADDVTVLFERNQDILNFAEEVEWLAETIEDVIIEYATTVIESEE